MEEVGLGRCFGILTDPPFPLCLSGQGFKYWRWVEPCLPGWQSCPSDYIRVFLTCGIGLGPQLFDNVVVGAGAGDSRVLGELLLHGDADVFLPQKALEFLKCLWVSVGKINCRQNLILFQFQLKLNFMEPFDPLDD